MRYWITVHWPNPLERNAKHRHIFLPDKRHQVGQRMEIGDKICIYEAKSGRSRIILDSSGERVVKARKDGREGIVTIGEIIEPVKDLGNSPQRYTNGTEIWWRWQAGTDNHNDSGFVPRHEMNRILGYKPNYTLRGFGESSSGVKELSQEQFEAIAAAFRSKSPEPIDFRQPTHMPQKYGPGGEGATHKQLKEFVASHPDLVFDEAGIEHLGTEVCTPSGDRIDVLLRDNVGRLLAVEIEIIQGAKQFDGICQAIKYRFMSCLIHSVDFEASRSALVAYDIDESLDAIARRYSVQLVRIPRELVSGKRRIDSDYFEDD